jgi:hypothetical protein
MLIKIITYYFFRPMHEGCSENLNIFIGRREYKLFIKFYIPW